MRALLRFLFGPSEVVRRLGVIEYLLAALLSKGSKMTQQLDDLTREVQETKEAVGRAIERGVP